jgi:hypothetical protein
MNPPSISWLPGIRSLGEVWGFFIAMFLTLGVLCLLMRNIFKKYTIKGRIYFVLAVASLGIMGIGAGLATAPSSAPRLQDEGRTVSTYKHHEGKNVFYTVAIVGEDGKQNIFRLPFSPPTNPGYEPYLTPGQLLKFTYLDEHPANDFPRIIYLSVLDGPHAGWVNSVNADWVGPWMLIPVGITGALIFIGFATVNRLEVPDKPLSNSDDQLHIT